MARKTIMTSAEIASVTMCRTDGVEENSSLLVVARNVLETK